MWSKSHWKQTGHQQKDASKTKSVKKVLTESGRKGGDVVGGPPGRGHRREYHEPGGLNHQLDTANLWSDIRKTSSLSWFENKWDLQEGCKNPRLLSWWDCTACLFPGTRWRKQAEPAWSSGQFLTREKCLLPRKSVHLGDVPDLDPTPHLNGVRGHTAGTWEVVDRKLSGSLTGFLDSLSVCLTHNQPPALAAERKESAHLEGTEPTQTQQSRLLLRAHWDLPLPLLTGHW